MVAAKTSAEITQSIQGGLATSLLWIHREAGEPNHDCLARVERAGPVVEIAIDDHDGDDEIGVRLESGAVGVVDDEGWAPTNRAMAITGGQVHVQSLAMTLTVDEVYRGSSIS